MTATAPAIHADAPPSEGIYGWIATVDHKRIGALYLWTALAFFAAGGVEALLLRLQLARPNNGLLTPETYNQTFTMHGTTMIFLVVMPTLVGFANYFVPLMIGARDMAFPRLNAFSYWLFPLGGLLLHFSFLTGGAPDVGWFAYAPLSETPFSSTVGTDYWIVSLLVLGVGSVGGAVNLVATVLTLRAPGMTIGRLPLFVWMTFVTAILIVLAIPVLNAALVMLLIDRRLDTHFFLPGPSAASAGDAVLWQHLFWSFGHPEVYILALPAFGMISEILPVFSRKPIFGHGFVAASTVAIAFLSFGVWAHHMFAVGLGHTADLFFGASSMLIAVPTGVKIFNWIATMWGGSLRFSTAMLFATAFLVEFVIGGLSGVSFAVVPIDWQVTDTYYLVAHFHYVLFGGTAFAIMGAVYYWYPKMTGRLLSERLGRVHFWLVVLGFNLTFFVQHFLGLMGMPRRVFTYPDLPGWGALNMISTVGAFIMAAGLIVFVVNLAVSLRDGRPAGDNPWDGWTLEWATTSPPPPENFNRLPPVRGRRPLWDLAHGERLEASEHAETAAAPQARGDRAGVAAWTLVTSEASFFLALILAYLAVNARNGEGALPDARRLDLVGASVFTACLVSSSITFACAEHALARENRNRATLWLVATIALGVVFLVGQGHEYATLWHEGFRVDTGLYQTTFFTLTGFHGLHVTCGVLALLAALYLVRRQAGGVRVSSLAAVGRYWHFVDVVWLVVFALIYVRPHL